MRQLLVALLAVVVASACADDPGGDAADAAGTGPDAGGADATTQDAGSSDAADSGDMDVVEGPVAAARRPRGTPAEDCPSGNYAGGDWFTGDGVCRAELPRLRDWSCPPGWSSAPALVGANAPDDVGDPQLCVPNPPDSCPRGQIGTTADSGCRPIGLACPSGRFHDEATIRGRVPEFTGAIHYVDASAGTDGSGTLSSPRNRAQRAVVDAADGDIVVLAPGTYPRIAFLNNVAVVGSCAESTIMETATSANDDGTIAVGGGGGTHITDVTVRGPKIGALIAGATHPVTLEGIVIEQTLAAGMLIIDTAVPVRVKDVVIDSPELGGLYQAGVRVDRSSDVALEGVVIEKPQRYGIRVIGPNASVQATDIVIREVQPTPEGDFGFGVAANEGTTVTVRRALIDRAASFATVAGGSAETVLDLEDVHIRGTVGIPDKLSAGLAVGDSALLRARRVFVDGIRDIGLAVAPGNAELEDVVIRGARNGRGVQLSSGSATLRRTIVEDALLTGAYLADGSSLDAQDALFTGFVEGGVDSHGIRTADSSVVLSRVLVTETNRDSLLSHASQVTASDLTLRPSRPGSTAGLTGLHVLTASQAEVTRLTIEDFRAVGISMGHEGSTLTATDVVIERGDEAPEVPVGARCINQDPGTELDLERVFVTDVHALGGFAIGGVGRYSDVVMHRLQSSDSAPAGGGGGWQIANDADVVFERMVLDDVDHVGIVVWNTLVRAEDLVIRGTHDARERQNAAGIATVDGGAMEITRALLEENQDGAIVLASEAQSILREVEIRGTHSTDSVGPGTAVAVYKGGDVVIEGGWFHHNVGRGLTLFEGARAEISDAIVEGQGPAEGEEEGTAPDGIYLGSGTEMIATDCEIRDNARHGLVVSSARAVLTRCTITGNEIGIARELEAEVELVDSDVTGNLEDENACLAQCYERPDETESLPVLPGG